MDSNTLILILTALLPVIVTLGVGYIAGARGDYAFSNAGLLTKLVMLYALPMSIFSGMVTTPRSLLMGLGPLAIILVVGLILMYFIPLLVCRYVFRNDLANSALRALAIGSPAVPFIGTSVLPVLFGSVSASIIAITGMPQNIIQLPVTMLLLSIATGAAGESASLGTQIVKAVKQPVVWAPVLAFIIVLLNIHIPGPVAAAIGLLGKATGGLALFSAGVVLFSKKVRLSVPAILTVVTRNIIVPAICMAVLYFIHFPFDQLKEAVLTFAIPTGPIVIILAMQFKTAEQEMATTTALSMVASIVTMGAFIWLLQ